MVFSIKYLVIRIHGGLRDILKVDLCVDMPVQNSAFSKTYFPTYIYGTTAISHIAPFRNFSYKVWSLVCATL